MNLIQTASRRQRIIQYLLFLAITIAVVVGLAQTPDSGRSRVLVDGRLNPEKIPEWILWNHIFLMAGTLDSKTADRGASLWMERLHLPKKAMNDIVELGYEQLEMADDVRKEAEDLVADSKKAKPEKINHPDKRKGLKIELRYKQRLLESKTLEIRDKLKERIGEDAFLRLLSYARLQIAPNVVMGN
ncbi:MAG: hypothetical protein JXA73_21745 [Acidobacteria bacterium]|nr:hypothetical protein [Acidobacteriota bacterium]